MHKKQSRLWAVSLEKERGSPEEEQLVLPRRGDFELGFKG